MALVPERMTAAGISHPGARQKLGQMICIASRGKAAESLSKKAQVRFFRSWVGMLFWRSFASPTRFDRPEITPQLGAVLFNLVASFATIE